MLLIVKIICCSGIFIGFYHFVLQNAKIFRFNRFYLLATLVLSFSIPFMELGIPEYSTLQLEEFIPQNQQNSIVSEVATSKILPVPISENIASTPTFSPENNFSQNWNWTKILKLSGLLISLILFLRFSINLWKINRLIVQNERIKKKGFTLVKISENVSPFSFFRYLFVSKQAVENEKIQAEIFHHEFAHIRQKHTWDVIFIEFLLIFFWFNPFLYLYRKSIRINHEFLADEEVLNHRFDSTAYRHLLIEKSSLKSQTSLSSSFNYLVTKKRLIMLTKQTSQTKSWILKIFSIPLLISVMLLFSQKTTAQINPGNGISKESFRAYKKQIRKATSKETDEYGKKVKKINPSKLDKTLVTELYSQMDEKQQKKAGPFPKELSSDFNEIDKLEETLGMLNFSMEFSGSFDDLTELNEKLKSPQFQEKIKEINTKFNSPDFLKQLSTVQGTIDFELADGIRLEFNLNSFNQTDISNENGEYYQLAQKHYRQAQEYYKQAQPFYQKAQKIHNEAQPFYKEAQPFYQKAQSYYKQARIHYKKMNESNNESVIEENKAEYGRLMNLYTAEMSKYSGKMALYSNVLNQYGAEMSNYSQWMEKYGNEMSKYGELIAAHHNSTASKQ